MPEQKDYTVAWTVQVQADSPEQAARRARVMQIDPDTAATVFDVADDKGAWRIDVAQDGIATTPPTHAPEKETP
jgi:hypothetical protein